MRRTSTKVTPYAQNAVLPAVSLAVYPTVRVVPGVKWVDPDAGPTVWVTTTLAELPMPSTM